MDNGDDEAERPDGLAAVRARVAALERKEARRDGRRELWADISRILGALVTLAGGIIAVMAFFGLGY